MNYNFESREKGSTRHKLEEATYFYGQMKRTLEDDKVFSFNLSAFVTAARSVTWIMKVEFAHVTEFESWYEDKQKSMLSDDDFEFFNRMRKATIHINRVKPNKKVSIGIFESVRLTESLDRTVNRGGNADGECSSQDTKMTVIANEPAEKNVSTPSKVSFLEYSDIINFDFPSESGVNETDTNHTLSHSGYQFYGMRH